MKAIILSAIIMATLAGSVNTQCINTQNCAVPEAVLRGNDLRSDDFKDIGEYRAYMEEKIAEVTAQAEAPKDVSFLTEANPNYDPETDTPKFFGRQIAE